MSFHIYILSQTDSTNQHALRLFKAKKAQYHDLFIALDQQKGQGQGNHQWESEARKNLTFSFIIPIHSLPPQHFFSLTESITLACRHYLAQYLDNVSIKWVNDLYAAHKKIGGVLIQTISKGTHTHTAIVGIGINLNQTHFTSTNNATSLSLITGKSFSLFAELKSLITYLSECLNLLHNKAYPDLHKAYNHHCYLRGEKVRISEGGKLHSVYFESVNEKGQLIGKNAPNEYQVFSFSTARLYPLSTNAGKIAAYGN